MSDQDRKAAREARRANRNKIFTITKDALIIAIIFFLMMLTASAAGGYYLLGKVENLKPSLRITSDICKASKDEMPNVVFRLKKEGKIGYFACQNKELVDISEELKGEAGPQGEPGPQGEAGPAGQSGKNIITSSSASSAISAETSSPSVKTSLGKKPKEVKVKIIKVLGKEIKVQDFSEVNH